MTSWLITPGLEQAKQAHLRHPAHREIVDLLVEPRHGDVMMDVPTPRRG